MLGLRDWPGDETYTLLNHSKLLLFDIGNVQATSGLAVVEVKVAKPPSKPTIKAMYTYKGKTARELSMKKGDVLTLLNSSNKVSLILMSLIYMIRWKVQMM